MLKLLSPRNRIALGLTGSVIAIICMSRVAGFIPDRTAMSTKSRATLTETIALSCSGMAINGDLATLQPYLTGVVERNEELISAGLRDSNGELVASINDHADHWRLLDDEPSTDSQMHVPIYCSPEEKWGSVELGFTPLHPPGIIGLLDSLDFGMMLFLGSACFLAFSFILRLVLKHLDPSQAVPRRVRDALDSLAEGLMILDTRCNVLLANSALAGVLGVAPEKLVGQRSKALRFECEDDETVLPWLAALDSQQAISNARVRLVDAQNQPRVFLANCSPLLGHEGKYCGVMVTLDDVTQLEQSRVELRVARDAADAANQAKSDFLANMSHEIRTPMNAILGFTDVLRRGMEENPNQRMEYLNTIHSSGNHLIELINDILDLSKVEAGKMELEIREFCLPMLLHETVRVMLARAQQKNISLNYKIINRIPKMASSDSTRLRQILINLIGNAIKFTENGGVTVGCMFEKNSLVFAVADSGIGMTPDQSKRIFEAFTQADSSVTRKFGGTGLGLSISKKFVEALGGTLTVKSEVGSGSTFVVTIPVQADSTVSLDHSECQTFVAKNASQPTYSMQKLNPGTVLVVDDGETNRSIVAVVLKKHGIEILEAENGKDAIAIVESGKPIDVILMDMQMPVMDGYVATETLRATGHVVPIIALTGNVMQGEKQKCLEIGCNGFLPKPIDINKLIENVGDYLGYSADSLEAEASRDSRVDPKLASDPWDGSIQSQSLSQEPIEPWTSTLPLDDPEFCRIVQKFVSDLPQKLCEMEELIAVQDFAGMKTKSHWLKGAAGTVGLDRLTEPAKQLEVAALNCDQDSCSRILEKIIALTSAIWVPELATVGSV